MRKIVVLAVSAIMLVSCASFTQVTAPSSLTAYPGSPGDARGKVIRPVEAQTKATYVFGIGGMSKSANHDVLEKLRVEEKLKTNQALSYAHVTTTTKIYLCGIVMKRILRASALVVEFQDGSQEDSAETSTNTLYRYGLADLFLTPDILEKCEMQEIKEKTEMFYQEIRGDIDNEQYDTADWKYNVFKKWYNASSLYDIEIKGWIKDIGRRLSLK